MNRNPDPHSSRLIAILVFCILGILGSSRAAEGDLRQQLAAALERADMAGVRKIAESGRAAVGERAGVPEEADKFSPIPANGKWLTPDEAREGFSGVFPELEKLRWWRIGLDPASLTHPLREPAAVIAGSVAAYRGKLDGAERSLVLAKEAADFLLWAQAQAGGGPFPFPAARGVDSNRAFLAGGHFLSRMEKEGRLGEVVHNGWVVNDPGDGGMQFDNGECGTALLELYEATKESRFLDATRRAADWARAHPMVTNWNYNSFSVDLLSRFFQATGEQRYLDAAKQKALIGVIPGQIPDGPMAGRWMDAHNAKPAYHYIMLRALAHLAIALPKDDPARADVMNALRLGLLARNKDFAGPGAPNRDKAMETLLIVNRAFANDPVFLRETRSAEALEALGKLVSEQARGGQHPLDPRAWGQFLEFAAARSPAAR